MLWLCKVLIRVMACARLCADFFEVLRPEIYQYFIEADGEGVPFSRENRSVVYQRAKDMVDTLPMGTRRDVYSEGYEWAQHSLFPKVVPDDRARVLVGGPDCKQPYSASLLNISAMSFGALSKNAVLALNKGAAMGGFYHNTGEGGVSRYHLQPGGDIVWNVGTAYNGCTLYVLCNVAASKLTSLCCPQAGMTMERSIPRCFKRMPPSRISK